MRRRRLAGTVALLSLLAGGGSGRAAEPQDVGEARAVFQRNLDAIARRDREAYLACYRAPRLARPHGPAGSELGFHDLEKSAGEAWPDTFEAPICDSPRSAPGVVYGTYRYRVRYGADEHAGLSERLFLKTPAGLEDRHDERLRRASRHARRRPGRSTGATLVDGTGAPPVRTPSSCARRQDRVRRRAAAADPGRRRVTDVSRASGSCRAWSTRTSTSHRRAGPTAAPTPRRARPLSVREDRGRPRGAPGALLPLAALLGRDVRLRRRRLSLDARHGDGAPTTIRAPRASPRPGRSSPRSDHWLNLPAERQFIFLKDEDAAREGVRYLAARGADAVKVWYIVTPEQTRRGVGAGGPGRGRGGAQAWASR